jgi:glycosyltransferase involved in cell wall biosynthesis/GT2 family glycosyltransferase
MAEGKRIQGSAETPELVSAGFVADYMVNLLSAEQLASLFWRPARVDVASAWFAHIPFAYWLVTVARPRSIVELGTHNGVSYSALCEAVLHARLDTRCYAVDTWKEDDRQGRDGQEVFDDLRRFHDAHYGGFSELLRCRFDEALAYFSDASIDLLHIDGSHSYDDVKRDFASWLPKLSDRAIVLFHRTNLRERGFGVWRLWQELREAYPSFEFLHDHGLGMLVVGKQASSTAMALAETKDATAVNAIRERFALLGERWEMEWRCRVLDDEIGHRDAKIKELAGQQRAVNLRAQEQAARAEERWIAEGARLADATRRLRAEQELRSRAAERTAAARDESAMARLETARLRQQAGETEEALRAQLSQVAAQYNAVVTSTLWRATSPIRQIASRIPTGRRQAVRRFTRVAWWTVTLRLPRKLSERRRVPAERDVVASSPLFDNSWYLARYPDVAVSRSDPALHYLKFGAAEGRNPGPGFDTRWYAKQYAEQIAPGLHPYIHYLQHGRAAGFRPMPEEAATSQSLPALLPAPSVGADMAAQRAPAGAVRRVLYISGEWYTPGNHYRVVRSVEAARAIGIEAEWMKVKEAAARRDAIAAFDILVIWRAQWDDNVNAIVETARAAGATVLFDIDDLMVDPDLARPEIIDGIRSQGLPESGVRQHYERIQRTMEAADLCIATTEELASHMRRQHRPTFVIPNTFDEASWSTARLAVRRRQALRSDELVRIGYAGGSRTHQRDLAVAAEAIVRVLRERDNCRLVLFRSKATQEPLVDITEFPELRLLEAQIEWRDLVELKDLPNEIARFDINIAPLEVGNSFCEAKSELKIFEAGLVDVCTVASPTGPFRRAIRDGETGFLARDKDAWCATLLRLVDDPALRRRIGRGAYYSAIQSFGPRQRMNAWESVFEQIAGKRAATRAFELDLFRAARPPASLPRVPRGEIVFLNDRLQTAEVTVVIPLYNYAEFILEALDSVRNQTLGALDIVVVDDRSTDQSLDVVLDWMRRNAERFNRAVVKRNAVNSGLGPSRNAGIDAAETPFVMLLDADNRLLADCCESCLKEMRRSQAAFVYPSIRLFGTAEGVMGDHAYRPARLVGEPYIDAMALVAKDAWAAVGGYDAVRFGWEDYDFWCRMAERGFAGSHASEVLAEYRIHGRSMLRTSTDVLENKRKLVADIKRRHPWLSIVVPAAPQASPRAPGAATANADIDLLLPILRCPETGQPLHLASDGRLQSADGSRSWPVIAGRPVLFPGLQNPTVHPEAHLSNPLPESARPLIHQASGLVLNLSAGGTSERFDNVVEIEASIFRHTNIVADGHCLPFQDSSFEAAIVLNAFEHYRDPRKVAAEIFRVLKPGGSVLVRTAFLQPLHEKPWHFFNCTKYGLLEWFAAFETQKLWVSDNFGPGYSLSWLASECETGLRQDVSTAAADSFRAAPVGKFVDFWRNESARSDPHWTILGDLSQETQEGISAGFEYVGRRPLS